MMKHFSLFFNIVLGNYFINRSGDMSQMIKSGGRFTEKLAKIYAAELVLALEYLHACNIIFRDLKPRNVLFNTNGHVILTDFGLSKEGVADTDLCSSFCGSHAYLAPEVIARNGYGKSIDWYLLGVAIYEMLTGKTPYYAPSK